MERTYPVPVVYQSFLLRIWINCGTTYSHWNASLEDPSNHAMRTFNHPQDLFDYLLKISTTEKKKKKGSKDEE
jgi:hypothetical protein